MPILKDRLDGVSRDPPHRTATEEETPAKTLFYDEGNRSHATEWLLGAMARRQYNSGVEGITGSQTKNPHWPIVTLQVPKDPIIWSISTKLNRWMLRILKQCSSKCFTRSPGLTWLVTTPRALPSLYHMVGPSRTIASYFSLSAPSWFLGCVHNAAGCRRSSKRTNSVIYTIRA